MDVPALYIFATAIAAALRNEDQTIAATRWSAALSAEMRLPGRAIDSSSPAC